MELDKGDHGVRGVDPGREVQSWSQSGLELDWSNLKSFKSLEAQDFPALVIS